MGGGTSRTTVENAPLSNEEREFVGKQGQLLDTQIESFQRENELMARQFPAMAALAKLNTDLATRSLQIERGRLATRARAFDEAAGSIGVGGTWPPTTSTTTSTTAARGPLNPHAVDPGGVLRKQYTEETGQGAVAGDRNTADPKAGEFDPEFLTWLDKKIPAGTPYGNDQRILPPEAATSEFDRLSQGLVRDTLGGTTIDALSPADQARINEIYANAGREGRTEIQRIGEDLAARRGLRLTDTPAARPFAETLGKFERGLSADRAGAEISAGQSGRAFR